MNTEKSANQPVTVESLMASHGAEKQGLMEDLERKLQTNPESLTLNEWVMLISDFDHKKFGHVPQSGTMLKAFKELGELCDDPKDGSEYADMFILLKSIAGRNGMWNLARPLADKLNLIRGQEFVMKPNGTGDRIKGPEEFRPQAGCRLVD